MVTHPHVARPSIELQRPLARAYIQSLQEGIRPVAHPDVPEYESLLNDIDRMFVATHNNTQAFSTSLFRLMHSNSQLKELFNATPATIAPSVTPATESQESSDYPVLPDTAYLASELSKNACRWLDLYEQYSEKVSPEGYKDFHAFCGLWVLSTIAARRVYVPMGPDGIFPSLAIALTGRSSLFAKTITAKVGLKVLNASGLYWLLGDDETTPQKLLSDMAGTKIPTNYGDLDYDRQERIRRRLSMAGQRGWFYDEFGQVVASMSKQNGPMADFIGLFRKLDGCPETYSYSTRSYGQEVIEKPYLSFLANMTPDDIRPYASKGNAFWGNGFWARFIFLTPPIGSDIEQDFELGDIPVPYDIQHELREWNERLGVPECQIESIIEKEKETGRYSIERDPLSQTACLIDSDALQAWSRYRKALKRLMRESLNHDLDGSYQRLPDKALRIATLFASLDGSNRISLRHWARAQELAEVIRKNLHELYRQVNTSSESESATIENAVLNFLQKQGDAVAVSTIRKFGPPLLRQCDLAKLSNAVRLLSNTDSIEMVRSPGGKTVLYRYIAHKEETL